MLDKITPENRLLLITWLKEEIYMPKKESRAPIHIAAQDGNLEVVKSLIYKNADVNETDKKGGNTPLHFTATGGNLEVVKFLIKKGAKVSMVNQKCDTPLHHAAEFGCLEVVEYLVKHDAEVVNQANKNGITPVFFAAYNGHLNVVEYLVKHNANVNMASNVGITPLYIAARRGHLDVIKYLVEHGANVNMARNDGTTSIFAAVQNGHLGVLEYLARHNANVNWVDNIGVTPFYLAEYISNLGAGAILLMNGADFNQMSVDFYQGVINNIARKIIEYDEYPQKQLALAMSSHKRLGKESSIFVIEEDTMKRIIRIAEPPKITLDNVPLKHRDSVQKMIKQLGQKKKKKQTDEFTILGSADYIVTSPSASCSKPENPDFIDNKVKVLIRNEKFNSAIRGDLDALDDADVNLVDDNGFTLLHLAAQYGYLKIAERLLEKKDIEYYATDKNGDTPLHVAARNNHAGIVALLAGNRLINTNTVNKDGETPLLIAAKKGYLEVAKHLIKNNANIKRPDTKGNTPLDHARITKNSEIIQLLLENIDPKTTITSTAAITISHMTMAR
tara:strand:+ start:3256 stop:4935 length:1680 start_codon:yes stop_codon:yes gene_type:complete